VTHSQSARPSHAAEGVPGAPPRAFDRPRQVIATSRQGFDEVLNSEPVARLRRRWRRWRRLLPIGNRERHSGTRHRLGDQLKLIVAVPLVAVVAFAGLAFVTTVHQASSTGEVRELASLAGAAGSLAHALQDERAAAGTLLLAADAARQGAYEQKVAATDAAAARYHRRREDVSPADEATANLLKHIDSSLATLGDLRRQVRGSAQAQASTVAFDYRILIVDLLDYRDEVVRAGAPTGLADSVHAAAALARAAEAIGEQQVTVLRATGPGSLTPALRDEIAGTRALFDDATRTFTELAEPEWQVWYSKASGGADVLNALRLQDEVARTPGTAITVDPAKWSAAMSAWVARLAEVLQRIDGAVVDEVTDLRDSQMRHAGLEAAGVLITLVVAVLLTGYVGRRITRRLRLLQDAARTIAYQRLPTVVNELHRADPGTVNPDEVANRSAGEIMVGGSDEIAEVAQAFRAVHREAVRIAGEQAVMRSNVAEIFVHLSQREQKLVDAVLAQVDEVERDETDPDKLQQLYRLDHLATRMARINLSLLVLGGSRAARLRHEDVPLVKVLQAAISQIEHYKRVRFGLVDNDVAVKADAVDEIVHLLAELFDNATFYSPPDSEVWVAGRALGDRVIVQIGDEGMDLSPRKRNKLNEILADPPPIDLAAVRAMGLTVVGHIARRYNVKVELRPGQGIGTIAEITLPAPVFQPFVPGDRPFPPAPLPAAVPQQRISHPVERVLAGGTESPNLFAGAFAGNAPTSAPPAWPPHAEPVTSAGPAEPAGLTGPAGLVAPVDETIVLPIFQETSVWFQFVHPPSPEGPIDWESAADAGWIAAARAASPNVGALTASGLPIRLPQANLVPGAAAVSPDAAENGKKRDPAAIAAAMSAYARGVAGRRGGPQAS
jgi:signal transduction histidine kinase